MTKRTVPTDSESRVKRLGPALEVHEPGGFDPDLLPGPDDITTDLSVPGRHGEDITPGLTAAASPRGGEMADPPAAPDPSVSESSPTAGSGGGSGRSLVRPDSLSGAPGSRLADVSSLASTWTLLGIPVELQDDMTWFQIAKHTIDAMQEEIIRTRQPADAELLTAAYDAIGHVVVARGLLDGGAGS